MTEQVSQELLARVVREHAGRLAASLVSLLGDFSAAEDLVQDAIETALGRWPVEGIPDRPDAWLFTVARRRGLDVLRRESNYRAKLAQLQWPAPPEPDDRLRLIFTCCHPALSRSAQIALTLRVVCGLSTAQIAAAFVVPETTVAQRLTRVKRKITEAGIPYRIPAADDLPERLDGVLAVIYLLFNEGYLSSTAERAQARDLVDDAEWLAALLAALMPNEPEAIGLLALIRLHRARGVARFDARDHLVLLPEQDRGLWDRAAIEAATAMLVRAARTHHRPGPYQVQAAIVACHAEAERFADTDWPQIVVLYDMLLYLAPSPITRLHRAIAVRYARGSEAALAELRRAMVRDSVEQIMRTGTTDGVTISGLPTVLMTYRGAKTGKVRKTPLMRVEHEGRYAAVASKGGEPTNPQWYASLVAEPVIELQDGAATRDYRAREVFGDEKALWWRRAVDAYPDYADYQRKTDRQIPVFVLEPVSAGTPAGDGTAG